jgi:ribosomal protein L11 methyltransferase
MHELVLLCPEDKIESVSDALEALDAMSVSIEDADAQSEAERPLFGEPGLPPPKEGWQRSQVLALFESEAAAQDAARTLQARDFFEGCRLLRIAAVPEQDSVRLTQSQFSPVEFTPVFWIVPTWHAPPPQAVQVIRLDPGLAFGTGTHPTTRMCLRWIAQHPPRGKRVLDYGCGSGILAIAAALFGAAQVDAVDIDPAAVESAAANARANDVAIVSGLPAQASGQYALVLANILATPLKLLEPLLCSLVAPGGTLVLAGILERQAGELTQAYAPHARLAVADSAEGWVLMTADF